jgi:hypothetical protein
MAFLYGCAGRLTALFGGFWPGQFTLGDELKEHVFLEGRGPDSAQLGVHMTPSHPVEDTLDPL